MTYAVLKLIHIIGVMLIGAGLLGVWISDIRSRQCRELPQFSEAVRNIAVFYDGLVIPGALLLLTSGTWLIADFFGGWGFLDAPWLAGMVLLFAFEFVEGNTVTRLYFMRLRRLTREALAGGGFTPQLQEARAEGVPTFTHFLDLPILFVIVSLGTLKPDTWTLFTVGLVVATGVATTLTVLVPRLYPWTPQQPRRAVILLAFAFLAVPLAAEAQQSGKVYRIGVLEAVGMAENSENLSAFRQGLRELGYVEGQNFIIEYRSTDGRAERFPDLASELVRLAVDVIVTRGTPAALAARQATGTVPIVMASSGDPAAEGVVASLARPGGTVTGFHLMAPPDLAGRRLQLLKEMVPGLSRVGILWNPVSHYSPLLIRETAKAASAMGVQLHSFEVRQPEDFERTFEAAALSQIDALITVEDYLTVAHRTRIVEFAAMSRLPSMHGLREFVDAGGLVAYGSDRRDLFRRSASYVHRIFTGANPADLPVEEPTRFELIINLKTAKALGLTVPPSLLRRADRVIE